MCIRDRRHAAWERLGTTADVESPTDAYRRLRMAMLEAERSKLLKIRDTGNVSSEVLDEALGDADLEESMLTTLHQRQIAAHGVLRTPERNRGDCEHLRDADDGRSVVPLTPEGCAECLAHGKTNWVALRRCLDCGPVRCCDSSPDRHATEMCIRDRPGRVHGRRRLPESWPRPCPPRAGSSLSRPSSSRTPSAT